MSLLSEKKDNFNPPFSLRIATPIDCVYPLEKVCGGEREEERSEAQVERVIQIAAEKESFRVNICSALWMIRHKSRILTTARIWITRSLVYKRCL